MNIPEAQCCSGCGRELGLRPRAEVAAETCARCSGRLDALTHESGILLDCSACGGQFVEHAVLKRLLRERQRVGALMSSRPIRARLDAAVVKYLPCPECRELMNRKNFGGASGIVVDVCHAHGVWFDSGELSAVLAYVESGGPIEPKQPRTRETFKPAVGLGGITHSEGALLSGVDLGAAALELLAFVVGVVKD